VAWESAAPAVSSRSAYGRTANRPRRDYGPAAGRAALREALAAAALECLTGGADDPLAGAPGLACIDHVRVGGLRARGQPRSTSWPAREGCPGA
jgi:hypothetical protein